MNGSKAKRKISNTLGVLQILIGVGGVPAGLILMLEPTGSGMGFSPELLAGTPFQNYFIPGLFLFAVNGLGSLVGGFLNFIRHRYAGETAVGLGILLMGWIIVQVGLLGLIHWMQPLYFGLGLIECVLGLIVRSRRQAESGT
jgi:hypothetical protein